jgi:2'-5' RNA ligase
MSESIRTFIAIEIPQDLRKKLSDYAIKLKNPDDKISWVSEDNLHLTLKFIGNIKTDKIDTIKKAIADVSLGYTAFTAVVQGMGVFPGERNPRVVWIGIKDGEEKICKIFKNLEEKLSTIGISKDDRPYVPHFTLGRIKYIKDVKAFSDKILNYKEYLFGSFAVCGISLIKSTLTPKGSIYEVLYKAKFNVNT